jgi:hypothetical protein
MSQQKYTFPGMTPFFEAAAAARGSDPQQLNRCSGLWHTGRIQEALGQLPGIAAKGDQIQLLAHAERVREGVALALQGIDAAILAVVAELDLPAPAFAQTAADTKPIRRREHTAAIIPTTK